jgi:hypothetical protein
MLNEFSFHLQPEDELIVRRCHARLNPNRQWLSMRCGSSEIDLHMDAAQLDAFIDSVTALRSKQDAHLASAPTQTHSLTEVTS